MATIINQAEVIATVTTRIAAAHAAGSDMEYPYQIHTGRGNNSRWIAATAETIRKAPIGAVLRWWDGVVETTHRKVSGDTWAVL